MIGITRLLRSQNARRMNLDTIFRLTTPWFECACELNPTAIIGIIIMLITLSFLFGTGHGGQQLGKLPSSVADLAMSQRISDLKAPTMDKFNASSRIYTKLTDITNTAQRHLSRSQTKMTNMTAISNSTTSIPSDSTFFSGPGICNVGGKCISPASVLLVAAVTTVFFFVVCWNVSHVNSGISRSSRTDQVDVEQGLLEKEDTFDDDEGEEFEQSLVFDWTPRDQATRLETVAVSFINRK